MPHRFKVEADPVATPARWLHAQPAPDVTPEVPAGFVITKLAARGRAPAPRVKGKASAHGSGCIMSGASLYYGSKTHRHNARSKS